MNQEKKQYLIYIILGLITSIGLYFRLVGLGKWPAAVDEYYIIKSVKSILDTGVPVYITGGYYERGIVYQYITALIMMTGLQAEYSARIFPVITNILTIIPLFILSKKLVNNTTSVLVVLIFSLSLWEVEFARFARMYSPFQLIFVTYLLCFYNYTIGSKDKYLKWLFILSTLSIFIYEASIFLILLNFLAITWNQKTSTINLKLLWHNEKGLLPVFTAVLIFILTYFYMTFNFREIGQHDLYPAIYKQLSNSAGGSFRTPIILLFHLHSESIWLITFIIPLGVLICSVYLLFRNKIISDNIKFMIVLLSVLCTFNLFGLMLVVLLIFLLLNWITRTDYYDSFIFLIPVFILQAFYWSFYSVFSGAYHVFSNSSANQGFITALITSWKEFLNFPYFYETFVLFRNTLPHLTILLTILLSAGLLLALFNRGSEKYFPQRVLYFILLFMITVLGALNLNYFDTRYFLFLYPLIILLSLSAIYSILETFILNPTIKITALTVSVFFLLFISEDFNLRRLINIDSKEINFRYKLSLNQKIHYYPRWDTRSPAEIINKNASPMDYIISNEQVNEQYLKKLDYLYIDYRTETLEGVSVDRGTRERWTGAKLIYEDKKLIEFLRNAGATKWLIINTQWGTRFLKKDNFFSDFKKYAVYANFDSSAIVYRIPSKIENVNFRNVRTGN